MHDDFDNYTVDLNGCFIIIRSVSWHKRVQYGEAAVRIEEIVTGLKESLSEIAVVEYTT